MSLWAVAFVVHDLPAFQATFVVEEAEAIHDAHPVQSCLLVSRGGNWGSR